ncbi:hypothetical protein P0082_10445 [Candidatus Haliotispira prima]|uniref:Uncharacterized protein n=1 Tax=Candidatus Haliotispira prima TaxID=3034016 RepID=A0ABY8MGA2_9SPIO|nr:hypothetical protein P0082_10445 [Candidatus Haliotispira prima]
MVLSFVVCLAYTLFLHPRMREQSIDFTVERSADSLKTFGTLSLIKGGIEAGKSIPVLSAVIGYAEPIEELIDILWRLSLFSYVLNQILGLYTSLGFIPGLSIVLVLLYLLVFLCARLWPQSGAYRSTVHFLRRPLLRTLFRCALFLAVVLPLYILLSSAFYRYYEKAFIEPEYLALTAMFADVRELSEQLEQKQGEEMLLQNELGARIEQNRELAEGLAEEMGILDRDIAAREKVRGWFQSKDPEQLELEARRRQLARQRRELLETTIRESRELARSQGKGTAGLSDIVFDYLKEFKDYTQAYRQAFLRLMSAEGQQIIRNYIFNSLVLSTLYFVVFPLLMFLLVRSMVKGSETSELRHFSRELKELSAQVRSLKAEGGIAQESKRRALEGREK